MKNIIYAIVIVICVLVAAVVFVKTHSGHVNGIDSIPESEKTWVKCVQCGAAYQMSEREYYRQIEDRMRAHPTPMTVTPRLTCAKCGKDGIVRAVRCEKCGEIFVQRSVPADFEDRCPKCGYSKTEAGRKARLAERSGP
jgi:phage FluMu protein Com